MERVLGDGEEGDGRHHVLRAPGGSLLVLHDDAQLGFGEEG